MKITIEFNENDVEKHRSEIVEALLQITDIGYVSQTYMKKQEQKQAEVKKERPKQEQKQPEVEKKQAKPVKQTPQYDVVDLQKAAFEKAKQIENGVEKVKALIKKYGVETLPEMDKKHYEAFLKELEELV